MRASVTASGRAMVESLSHAPYAMPALEGVVLDSAYLHARMFLQTVSYSTVTKSVKHRSYSWTVTPYRFHTHSVRTFRKADTRSYERIHTGFECIHMHKSSQKANIFDPTPSKTQTLKTKVRIFELRLRRYSHRAANWPLYCHEPLSRERKLCHRSFSHGYLGLPTGCVQNH